MNDDDEMYTNSSDNVQPTYESTPRWIWLAFVALAVVSIVGLGVGWSASEHASSAEQALATQGKSVQQNVDKLSSRLSQEEQVNNELQSELGLVTDRLKMTQGELTSTRRQTTQIRDEYSKKLDNVQSELGTKASADDVSSLGGDVNGVKTDLAATNNNLQMARGEMGTLIAKNHDEIDQLRRMGERDYFEFTLAGKGNRSKVGNLAVELRGTDTKKGQFTVALYVDDMRLEKKNRSVDEPIYFYTQGTRAPLEMVINKVEKDKVVGYLSAPKGEGRVTSSSAATSGH
jgi:TolA-binding protein